MPNQARPRNPLRTYQFSIWIQPFSGSKVCVAGVQKVSGLSSTVSATEVWEGGNNLHRYANPDRVTWDPVTLEQGLALDDTLERWALSVRSFVMNGRPDKSEPVKRDVAIELIEPLENKNDKKEKADRVRRYILKNAWISKYSAMPRLDALASEVALASVELIHEGFTIERAAEPSPPDEPPNPPPLDPNRT